MPTHLQTKLMNCANSHRGGTRALNPKPCGNDWCNCCKASKDRTSLIVDAAQHKFQHSNTKLYHTTGQIGPTMDYQQARNIMINILHKFAEHDIDCVGSLEYSDPKDTAGWKQFFKKKPFYKGVHKGEAHFHGIFNQYFKKDDAIVRSVLFNYEQQLWQQMQGIGKYKDQSTEDFITRVIQYGRKRNNIQAKEWFKSIKETDQQLSFKVEYGEVFLWDYGSNDWVEHVVTIGERSSLQGDVKLNEGWRNRSESLNVLEESGGGLGSVMYKDRMQIDTSKIEKKKTEIINELFEVPIKESDKKVKKKSKRIVINGVQLFRDRDDIIKFGKFKGRSFEDAFKDREWLSYTNDYLRTHHAKIYEL